MNEGKLKFYSYLPTINDINIYTSLRTRAKYNTANQASNSISVTYYFNIKFREKKFSCRKQVYI